MKKFIVFLSIIAMLLSCENKKEKQDLTKNKQEQINPDFEKYLSSLDQIPLPLKANPLGELPDISKNFDKKGFEKYKHNWAYQPLGILYKDKNSIGIIDYGIGDWGKVPFLTTYDYNGNKIDSTDFYNKSGEDMGYEAIEYVTFNKNKTIIVLDTVKNWKINEDGTDRIDRSLKITTGKVEYVILKNGKIERK